MNKSKYPTDPMRYIDMEFEEALQRKWESGKVKHRKGEREFTGDPVEELFQELLDAFHYVLELENRGANLAGYRTTFRNMALNLQSRKRELSAR